MGRRKETQSERKNRNKQRQREKVPSIYLAAQVPQDEVAAAAANLSAEETFAKSVASTSTGNFYP
jgi:hypothetical protein